MKQQMTESPTNDKITVPYGAFVSGLSAQQVANGGLRLSQPQLNADSSQLFYLEGRPAEGGRQVLVVKDLISGDFSDINEAPINIRSLVHEYGGGAFALAITTTYTNLLTFLGVSAATLNAPNSMALTIIAATVFHLGLGYVVLLVAPVAIFLARKKAQAL